MEMVLEDYREVISGIRAASKILICDIMGNAAAGSDQFIAGIERADKAMKTLKNFGLMMEKLKKAEVEVMEKLDSIKPPKKNDRRMTPQEFEIILRAAHQFGLLKENARDEMERVIDELYERGVSMKLAPFDDPDEEEEEKASEEEKDEKPKTPKPPYFYEDEENCDDELSDQHTQEKINLPDDDEYEPEWWEQ